MARRSTELLKELERKLASKDRRPQPRQVYYPGRSPCRRHIHREELGLEQLVRNVPAREDFPTVYVILDSSYLSTIQGQNVRELVQTAETAEGKKIHYIMTTEVIEEIQNPSYQRGGRQTTNLVTGGLRKYISKKLTPELVDVGSMGIPEPTVEHIVRTCGENCRKQQKHIISGGPNGDPIENTDIEQIYLAMQLQRRNNYAVIMTRDTHIIDTVAGLKKSGYRISTSDSL